MGDLVTAITAAFSGLVTQITTLFTDNIGSIMTVVGLGIIVAVGIGLIRKMKAGR